MLFGTELLSAVSSQQHLILQIALIDFCLRLPVIKILKTQCYDSCVELIADHLRKDDAALSAKTDKKKPSRAGMIIDFG